MAKFINTIQVAIILALSAPCLAIAGPPNPDDLKAVARKEIANLAVFSIQGIHDLGFDNRPDIEKIVLGEGFEIFTIDPDKLLDESSPQNLQSLVTTTNVWYFPLVVDGNPKTLLKLGFTAGKWSSGSLGSAKFLKEIVTFREAWPASSGYQYRLIHIRQASSHIIELSQNGKFVGIVPLSSFYRADSKSRAKHTKHVATNPGTNLPFDPHDLRSDPKEVLSDLRASVRSRLRKE
jgi:hypothetical protein